MDNPRPEKVAVVEEVRERLSGADAALLTEYRGINVTAMADLRRALRRAGGDYKIYKNTLVRFAARDLGLEIEELLTGPTAIAFIAPRHGSPGDPVTVARALRDFARTHPALVVKGGLLGDKLLSAAEARALADVAPREELLARLAGGMASSMQRFAGLLQALPRNLAYGLQALIDQGGAAGDGSAEPAVTAEPEPETRSDEVEEPPPAEQAPAEGGADGASAEQTDPTDAADLSGIDPTTTSTAPTEES